MNILVNATSSLLDDYNEMVEGLYKKAGNDRFYRPTLISEADMDNFEVGEYDVVINLIDDDEDVLDNYFHLYDLALKNGKINNFLVYYKKREYYNNERVYYSRKDANRYRKHRFLDYNDPMEVVFDIMMHSALYFGADVNVKNGMLRFKNYDIIDLSSFGVLNNNVILKDMASNIRIARDENNTLMQNVNREDASILQSIEDVRKYMDKAFVDYDRYLGYAIDLYKEIIYSFGNKLINDLDYIFVKEYFAIGHYTSITSCFNRGEYKDFDENNIEKADDMLSFLIMVVYSMAFAKVNEFVVEVINDVFNTGKEIELKFGIDRFFNYHSIRFDKSIDIDKENIDCLGEYIDLIESRTITPNKFNAYSAYTRLSSHAIEIGDINRALDYCHKALDYAPRKINIVNTCKTLFEIYRINADKINEEKYIDNALKYDELMLGGYHDDYASVVTAIINISKDTNINKKCMNNVLDEALKCTYMDKENYYYLYLKKMFDFDNELSDDDRIAGLNFISQEMIENYNVRPLVIFVGIYNSLLVLGKLYEGKGDKVNADASYKKAYEYLSILESINADIDEHLAYVQYRLGDIAIDMDSNKSYRHLAKAEKRIFQHIMKSNKYVEFYSDVLISINDRYYIDKRYKIGNIVARSNLNKILECCKINDEYFKDAVVYCNHMMKTFNDIGDMSHFNDYLQLRDNYVDIAKKKNIQIEE